ncbi:hypothetical protein UFOVP257_410 [uncultured Caudovirales phage]|uniref:SGNH_hydrolase domain containing protein n=1 Tax=uncultured Caudovirales phage TaxID=2100421 RepID=A0A6J5LG58_9CAUD|nr:hypothetical protein UFOVP257_410 [uncultured Caudovirales phage]
MILINGCSFTTGEESPISWTEFIPNSVNLAKAGASNDYIIRSTVLAIELEKKYDKAIIAWTSPNRIEIGDKHLTPSSQRKYGNIVDEVFEEWDENWAYWKFISQVELLHAYLNSKSIPHLFVSAFDIQQMASGKGLDCYLGWPNEGFVEWIGDCPKAPGGHPLDEGHVKIANKINEYIRRIGWIS